MHIYFTQVHMTTVFCVIYYFLLLPTNAHLLRTSTYDNSILCNLLFFIITN